MDLLGQILDYEEGRMDSSEQVLFFQDLIDEGLAWELQGHYGRMAMRYIEAGLCTMPKEG